MTGYGNLILSSIAILCHTPEANTPATMTPTCIIPTKVAFLVLYMARNYVDWF